ncbi:MAG: lipoate--protein ligase family protein [Actinobacteria bacterium]|nr:lipoate--protein ligase family protein [Actinomycetota bacterium]
MTTPVWKVERRRGTAQALHAAEARPRGGREAWLLEIDRPAMVLGSTQRAVDIDERAARQLGLDIMVRRSGGGAVLLVPGDHVWIDVFLPRDDPLWVADVSKSALWLGERWVAALRSLGVVDARVYDGAMRSTEIGRLVCFAGLAAGEVTVDGAKLVGISQRRTRHLARFQGVVLRSFDVEPVLAVLGSHLDVPAREALRAIDVATVDAPVHEIEAAFVEALC